MTLERSEPGVERGNDRPAAIGEHAHQEPGAVLAQLTRHEVVVTGEHPLEQRPRPLATRNSFHAQPYSKIGATIRPAPTAAHAWACYDGPSSRLAGVAQLVEQLIRNQQVEGSSPFAGSIHPQLPTTSVHECDRLGLAPRCALAHASRRSAGPP
jgi:hypothetical protein